MDVRTTIPDESISLFVRSISVFEETEVDKETVLPFFADGYPGLIFHETPNGLLVNPFNKVMPSMFLYGQTIHPIELRMTGNCKLIVFQLYPFVLKAFFNLVPKDLVDDCCDAEQWVGTNAVKKLTRATNSTSRIKIVVSILNSISQEKQKKLDLKICGAIQKIIAARGQTTIGAVCKELHVTERTFQRRFFDAVGVTAKQFAKIIQFQHSFEQLTTKDFTKLTDIVYANGFADQSHFIRVFKSFTGKTPAAFKE